MNSEAERLSTFQLNKWENVFVTAESLALVGFQYWRAPDVVKCVFCGGTLKQFEPNDTALGEHIHWYPNCPLLKRRNVGNIPIDATKLDQVLPPLSYDTCGFSLEFQQRLESFEGWPRGDVISPSNLAEAGFYYTGESDRVVCVCCNLSLSNWEMGDDAWSEHQRHLTSDCEFLNQRPSETDEGYYSDQIPA
jgi:baculoviral IAP repeat-containing protein 7/8